MDVASEENLRMTQVYNIPKRIQYSTMHTNILRTHIYRNTSHHLLLKLKKIEVIAGRFSTIVNFLIKLNLYLDAQINLTAKLTRIRCAVVIVCPRAKIARL